MKHKGAISTHEKAILVSLAYIIGFITALIAFVLSNKEDAVVVRNNNITAQAVGVEYATADSELEIMENEEGLFIVKNGKERIISAKSEDPIGMGYHTEIFSSSLSPNQQYVHYCASTGGDECTHIIYSVAEDASYIVKNAEGAISSQADGGAVWSPNNELLLNGEISVNSDSRWKAR